MNSQTLKLRLSHDMKCMLQLLLFSLCEKLRVNSSFDHAAEIPGRKDPHLQSKHPLTYIHDLVKPWPPHFFNHDTKTEKHRWVLLQPTVILRVNTPLILQYISVRTGQKYPKLWNTTVNTRVLFMSLCLFLSLQMKNIIAHLKISSRQCPQ